MLKLLILFILSTSFAFAQSQTGGGNLVGPGCTTFTSLRKMMLDRVNQSYDTTKDRFVNDNDGLKNFYKLIEQLREKVKEQNTIKLGLNELDGLSINEDKKQCGLEDSQRTVDPELTISDEFKLELIKQHPWLSDPKVVQALVMLNKAGHNNKVICTTIDAYIVSGYIEFLELFLPGSEQEKENIKTINRTIDHMQILNGTQGYGG